MIKQRLNSSQSQYKDVIVTEKVIAKSNNWQYTSVTGNIQE